MKHDSATAADKAVKDTPQEFSNRTGRDVAVRTQQKCVEVTAVAPAEYKTVAGRLREMNRKDVCGCLPQIFHAIAGLGRIDDCLSRGCDQCFKDEANNLADMIEAEKAKVAADATHEAMQVDVGALIELADKIDTISNEIAKTGNAVAEAFRVPSDYVLVMPCDTMYGWADSIREIVKRPEPEVLDADGVPIKVGDTVYTPQGKARVVSCLNAPYVCHKEGFTRADYVTHRKPDTLEDLRNDAEEFVKSLGDGVNATYVFTLLERLNKLLGGE